MGILGIFLIGLSTYTDVQAAESADILCGDLKKGFIVAGMSAGGHFATVIAHRARDDSFFKDKGITGQVIQVPPIIHPSAIPDKYASSNNGPCWQFIFS